MFGHSVDKWGGAHSLISSLFPPTCVLCGAPGVATRGGMDLCVGCEAELPHNRECCARCAIPFDSPMPVGAQCGGCLTQPPPFDLSLSAFRYEGAVVTLVAAAKFRGRLNVVRLLGRCLADRVREAGLSRPEILLPVPLHASRLRTRGYNQALEIGRVVGKELDLPIDHSCCSRIQATPPQAGLEQKARRRNVRGAFVVEGPLPWTHIAILDDVVTTGSTVGELSRVLRKAGATRIQVWSVARTP
jgi:ComF family protein